MTCSSDPRADGSTRRIATVTSSVPDAFSARSSTSWLGAPPVPMINRDAKRSPAMTSASPTSTSLDGMQHLNAVTRLDLGRVPPRAQHDVAVTRDGDAARGRQLHQLDEIGDGRSVAHAPLAAVDDDDGHATSCGTRANRAAENGATSAGGAAPVSSAAI